MSVNHTITGGLVQLSGNPIQIIVRTDSQTGTNYKCALKITCDQLRGSPFVEEIKPENLISVFDISGFVDQPSTIDFDYPAQGACNPHDPLVFHVSVQSGEIWIDQLGERIESWGQSDVIRILKGKLRPYQLAVLNQESKNFNSEYIEGGKFLTNLPTVQRVAPHQVPLLWYVSRWTDHHGLTLNCRFKTLDGTIHLITQEHVIWDITAMVDFAVQPLHLGYYGNQQVEEYEFWLNDTGGDISEHRYFKVDNNYFEKSFIFYYINPLSGIDCIWLTGQYSEGLKTETEIAYRPVAEGSGTKVASLIPISASGQRSWELNTGSKSRDELLQMRDFLESRQQWMVDSDYQDRLIPVIVESGDFTLFDCKEDVQSLNIKIVEAHK
jgi:hypothetical protein